MEQKDNNNSSLELRAKEYAISCHVSTNHAYGPIHPYSFHLQMVVDFAKEYIDLIPEEHVQDVLAASWCHDLIEDTRQTYNDVKANTNEAVADMVYALTNEKGKTRSQRANDKYYQGIKDTPFAVFIKLCDRLANFKYSIDSKSFMALKYAKENKDFIHSLIDMKAELYEPLFKRLYQMPIDANLLPSQQLTNL